MAGALKAAELAGKQEKARQYKAGLFQAGDHGKVHGPKH